MIDANFCELLELRIDEALANSYNEDSRYLWCDGVLLPEFAGEYSRKHVNNNRQVSMIAFIGTDGQGRYELTIRFGHMALSRYGRGLDIAECIPAAGHSGWFSIDVAARRAVVQLL